ncbi:uncharacterized protein LOC126896868 isoform X2 [Daktulosphaira vitifoliae]|uniref:uncharacterized protein LOC126896868 isoform X2 n=1 Tax=Daktulosphaira vitifoliae TaxID=58002 RepID=UPI0021AAD89F|nr:uncharacterized protein LOC126896868 isoform X2 [Daktulosphaira vitifoliae]
MNIVFYILMMTFLTITHMYYFVNCKIKSQEYKKYVIEVLSHMCNQHGWNTMPHILVKDSKFEKLTISEAIKEKDISSSYIHVLHLLIYSLNCRYAEIIFYYDLLISIIINKCNDELTSNNTENFKICIIHLYDAVKDSSNMFDKLFNAMKFMNQIDLRLINKLIKVPTTFVNELKPFVEFTRLKVDQFPQGLLNADELKISQEFLSIKNFHDVNAIEPYLRIVYDEEYFNCLNKSKLLQTEIIKKKLQKFYYITIENDFVNCGFMELLEPSNHKLIPPQLEDENLKTDVSFFNTIMQKDGWKLLNHIKIVYNDQCLNFDDIKCQVDNNNKHVIKTHLAKLLRCRYIEILYIYTTILSSLIHICRNEKKNNTHYFFNCVTQLYHIINKSSDMFNRMLSALLTIRLITKKNKDPKPHLCIEKVVEICIYCIKDILSKYPPKIFFFENQENINMRNVYALLNEIIIFLNVIKEKLLISNYYVKRFCIIKKKTLEIEDEINNALEINLVDNKKSFGHLIKPICEYFNIFHDHVIRDDCDNLGFSILGSEYSIE